MTREQWKPIPSQPGYEVSDLGRVRSVARVVQAAASSYRPAHGRKYPGKILKPGRTKSGHMTVACGRGNSRSVHVLVLEAFIGPCPIGAESLHRNDQPGDNRLKNLIWGTRSENLRDKVRNGRMQLTYEQAREVRRRYRPGCPVDGGAAMARELGVEAYIIYSVTSGANYVEN